MVTEKSWWRRNWKWVVPVGCFAGLVVLITFIGLLFMLIFGAIKSSDVYQQAVNTAVANEHLVQRLGGPVETGWFLNGSIRTTG
ncbi:MAG: cytochrome c oxidase assembly factor Coa1 family protein, partial [Dehalococcoidia bacterium]|nr:cytochrome c oxidase assembly factor Coa1 family protein [Dehalococcoidia bacterium]